MIFKKSYLAIFTLLFITMQAFAQENKITEDVATANMPENSTETAKNTNIEDIFKKLESSIPQKVKLYSFNPILNSKGHILVHEFNDLSCYDCLEKSKSFYSSLKSTDEIKVIYKNMYSEDSSLTKQTAIYGIIANNIGKFWQFKQELTKAKANKKEDFINLLDKVGVSEKTIYDELMLNSDKYYKQLDADNNLAIHLKDTPLPIIFVNGYQVGQDLTQEEAVVYLNYLSEQEHIKQEEEQNKYKIGKF